ncbi:MAG: cytochrome c biogenesis CcdA family protein [Burkholderiales bacterium]
MAFGPATYGLAALAGTLSTLSPCVLPLVPIVVGTAAAAHRLGPVALGGGLALSFTVVGTFVAALGSAVGLTEAGLRIAGAVLLVAFGVVLLSEGLQSRLAAWTSGLSGAGQNALTSFTFGGLAGQFLLGSMLGLVWSPCVGPTLGATVTLASQGEDLGQVALVMGLFGLGAGIPLVGLGLLSRQVMTRIRGRLLQAGKAGKRVLGAVLLLVGLAVLTGLDKRLEANLLDAFPAWLVDLTTSI